MVHHCKDAFVLAEVAEKIEGRDKNPTPFKIQYPMKNLNQRYCAASH